MFDFHYQHGSARRKLFRASGDVCSIGSARSNDLILDTRSIGKRHAELRLRPDGVHIRDLGSLQGCWVNRERVVEHGPLSELDEIAVGDVSIVLGRAPMHARDSEASAAGPNGSAVRSAAPHAVEEAPVPRPRSMLRVFGFGGGRRDEKVAGHDEGEERAEAPTASRTSEAGRQHDGRSSDAATASDTSFPNGVPLADAAADVEGADIAAANRCAETVDGTPNGVGSAAANGFANRVANGAVNGVADGAEKVAVPGTARRAEDASRDAYGASGDRLPDAAESAEERAAARERERLDEQLGYWGGIVHEQLLYQMDLRRKDVNRMSDEELRAESTDLIRSIIASLDAQLPPALDREALEGNVLNESVGLGPLEQFLEDEDVTEIMVNNHREIFVEKGGRLERSRYRFSSDRTVHAVIERIITPIGRRIDESSPIVDARLKDGSRVNAIIPPLALKGPSLTIRKFPKHRLRFDDLVKYGSIDQGMVDFLRVCVERRRNIIVSGGTGSGKTTLLNVLSNFIPDAERIVTIEDAAELKLVQPNLVSLEARPSNLEGKGAVPIRDLVKNSLRMRPDRIVVGECRGGEALDMLQAMNTGHDGSLTTVHANNPRDVISRLEVLVLMAGMDLPVTAIREQVASAVDLIIQQTRFHCGSRKITKITEVVGVESGTVQLQDIFVYAQEGLDESGRVRGRFRATGAIPTFYEELRSQGIEVDLSGFEPSERF